MYKQVELHLLYGRGKTYSCSGRLKLQLILGGLPKKDLETYLVMYEHRVGSSMPGGPELGLPALWLVFNTTKTPCKWDHIWGIWC